MDGRDDAGCTPLHVALLAGHLGAAAALLDGGADPNLGVEGSPALHLAVCAAALPGRAADAVAAVDLLTARGASPYSR